MSPTISGAEASGAPELAALIAGQTSQFGQLVALCTFRDFNPLGLATRSGGSAMEPWARRLHEQILDRWLSLPLAQQKRDVAAYLARIGAEPAALGVLVARAEDLTPEGSMPVQRDLFAQNLAIVYLMLMHEWDDGPANRVYPFARKETEGPTDALAKNVIAA
jgi:hypothetical protein